MGDYSFVGDCACCGQHVEAGEKYTFSDDNELVCEDCSQAVEIEPAEGQQ